jgi:hypothetical protein
MSRDFGATMIVLGRTGKDWFHQYWLGGVSHQGCRAQRIAGFANSLNQPLPSVYHDP